MTRRGTARCHACLLAALIMPAPVSDGLGVATPQFKEVAALRWCNKIVTHQIVAAGGGAPRAESDDPHAGVDEKQ